MIKNIIFDLGNVLLDQKTVDADVYFASVLHISPEAAKIFYAQYKRKAVCGYLPFADLVNLYKTAFKAPLTTEEITRQYTNLYIQDVARVNMPLLELIKQLKRAYAIYMMTNTLEPHFDHWTTLGFSAYFDRIFRSDTDHFAKPEKQAYEYVLGQIGAKASDCVFIDDLPTNVAGATQVGMHGIVYTNLPDLTSHLAELGVPLPASFG